MKSLCRRILCLLVVGLPFLAKAATSEASKVTSYMLEAEKARYRLGFPQNMKRLLPIIKNLKIAILDNGFSGVPCDADPLREKKLQTRRYLPHSTKLICQHDPNYEALHGKDDHGRRIAQIIWSVLGFLPNGPRFFLYNSVGPANFEKAIEKIIQEKIDIVVFSQNWEFFGNFDGSGPINKNVTKAMASGSVKVWLQAAGNYGGIVSNGKVQCQHNQPCKKGDYVYFGHSPFVSFFSQLDENQLNVKLSWEIPWVSPYRGTQTDLGLYLYDPSVHTLNNNTQSLAVADRVQVLKENHKSGQNQTLFPREVLKYSIKRSGDFPHRLAVRVNSDGIDPNAKLRLSVLTQKKAFARKFGSFFRVISPLRLVNPSRNHEIMIPGDHPDVITVGSFDEFSAKGPTSDGRPKPDIYLPLSKVKFSDEQVKVGVSFSTALAAPMAAVVLAQAAMKSEGRLSRSEIIVRMKQFLRIAKLRRPLKPVRKNQKERP